MAGLSIWHILLFLLIVVLLFGTSKLKNLGKDLGGAVKDFKSSVREEDKKAEQRIQDDHVLEGTVVQSNKHTTQI